MRSLKKLALLAGIIAAISMVPVNLFAADFYIAQTATGTGDGSSCTNARASTWDWAGVADGDTVYLCGTFTSTVYVQASGTSEGIIIKSCKDGEANCGTGNAVLFTAPYWGTSGAIACKNHSNITIDGNGVGTIQATANGDASEYTNQKGGYGVYVYLSSYIEIKNWTIENIYVEPYDPPSPWGGAGSNGTVGIYVRGGSNISINNNTVHDAGSGIIYNNVSGTTQSNINLFENTVYKCSWGVQAIAGGSGTLTNNINIYGNDITIGANWVTSSKMFHLNGSFNYCVSGASISNLHFYNNYVHGPADPPGPWTCSGFIWTSVVSPGTVAGMKVYNNLLVGVSGDPANQYISIKGSGNIAENNTIIGYYNSNNPIYGTLAAGIKLDTCSTAESCVSVKNNILYHLGLGIYVVGATGSFNRSDNNLFYDNGYAVVSKDTVQHWYTTLSQWQAAQGGCPGTGHDCASITCAPDLSADYLPNSGSPLIGAGANLTSLGITALNSDKAGIPRPASGAWTIGAYQSTGALAAPSNLHLVNY
jgi:hypothetical protein